MGRGVEARVGDLVADQDPRLADSDLDAAATDEMLAEDRGLDDLRPRRSARTGPSAKSSSRRGLGSPVSPMRNRAARSTRPAISSTLTPRGPRRPGSSVGSHLAKLLGAERPTACPAGRVRDRDREGSSGSGAVGARSRARPACPRRARLDHERHPPARWGLYRSRTRPTPSAVARVAGSLDSRRGAHGSPRPKEPVIDGDVEHLPSAAARRFRRGASTGSYWELLTRRRRDSRSPSPH